MARFHQFVPVLALAAVAACGGKQVEETPEPVAQTPPPAVTPAPAPAPAPVAEAPAPNYDAWRGTLETRIHFALDRADLSQEAQRTLSAKAEILRQVQSISLRIDGHADERGSDEYNLALSQRRAAEAKRYLVGQGIAAARLETVGHGEERPLDATSSEAAWASNRRADFQVTGGSFSQR